MKLYICDRTDRFPFTAGEEDRVITPGGKIAPCLGCFGCWVKTPSSCVIRDDFGDMGKWMAESEEVIIFSKCVYGGYSSFVKNVLDRCISFIHPNFRIVNGEMHHRMRYELSPRLTVLFYGQITEREKETAEKLVQANAVNFGSPDWSAEFLTLERVGEEQ